MKVFKTIGFQTKIETNFHEVNFLNKTFNSRSGKYCLYYSLSNHHPQIIKQPSLPINETICNNSSNEIVFESTTLEYQEALKKVVSSLP